MEAAGFKALGLVFLAILVFTEAEFCSDCSDKVGVPCAITAMQACHLDECVPHSDGLSPRKVEDAAIENIVHNGQLGFNVSFGLPKDYSRNRLIGVLVKIMRLQSASETCYCVDISKAHCIPLEFYPRLHVDCSSGLRDESDYSIIIQSLPVSSETKNYIQLYHRVGNITGPNLNDPCQWKMNFYTYEINDSVHGPWDITLTFDYAPQDFKFRKYFFNLVSNNNSNECSFKDFIQDKNEVSNFDLEGSTGQVTLTTPYTGDQCIKVVPTCGEDSWWDCDELVQRCNGQQPLTNFRIPINASTTSQRLRTRRMLQQRDIAQSEVEPCEGDPNPGTKFNIVAVVVPTVLIAIVVIIAGLTVLLFHKNRRQEAKIESPPMQKNSPVSQPSGSPSVLLIYSNDFKEHESVILSLVVILNKCGFNVMCHRLEENASASLYYWMLDSLDKADKVLIVHSQGTYERYMCQRHCRHLTDNKPPPHHDLFDIFVQHFISKYIPKTSWQTMGKFINVRFDYTDKKCVIDDFMGQASNYVLMDHIEDLVAKLYGTTGQSEKFHLHHIDWGNFDKYDYGYNIKKAVDGVIAYLKAHPKWFEERYTIESETLKNVQDDQGQIQEQDDHDQIQSDDETTSYETTSDVSETTNLDSGFQENGELSAHNTSLPPASSSLPHHLINPEFNSYATDDQKIIPSDYYTTEPVTTSNRTNDIAALNSGSQDLHPPTIDENDEDDDNVSIDIHTLSDFRDRIRNINC